mmetsp:Transcript_19199/g.24915  ORF Transcript_19199/g.24915 Transcript_19199/m.24915 type:complete len:217 (+) Transcript_19199:40-690(+)
MSKKRQITMKGSRGSNKGDETNPPSLPPPRGLLAGTRRSVQTIPKAVVPKQEIVLDRIEEPSQRSHQVIRLESELSDSREENIRLKALVEKMEKEKELLINVLHETQTLAIDARRDEGAAGAAAFSALSQHLLCSETKEDLERCLQEVQTQFESAISLIQRQDKLLERLRLELDSRTTAKQHEKKGEDPRSSYYLRAEDTSSGGGTYRNFDIRLCV